MTNSSKQQVLPDLGRRRRMAKEDRLDQIFEAMMPIPFAIPLRDIARITGLKKTWHLRALVGELVEEGTLIETEEREQPGLRATRMFHINPDLR